MRSLLRSRDAPSTLSLSMQSLHSSPPGSGWAASQAPIEFASAGVGRKQKHEATTLIPHPSTRKALCLAGHVYLRSTLFSSRLESFSLHFFKPKDSKGSTKHRPSWFSMVPSLCYCLRLFSIGILMIVSLPRAETHSFSSPYCTHMHSLHKPIPVPVCFGERWDESQAMVFEMASALLNLVSSSERWGN